MNEELKNELINNFKRFIQILIKQEEIETTTGLSEDALMYAEPSDYDELEGLVEEWQSLEKQRSETRGLLEYSFAQASMFPVLSLSKELREILNKFSRIFTNDKDSSVKGIEFF